MLGASVPSSLREERKAIFMSSGEKCSPAGPFPLLLAPIAVAFVSAIRPVPSPLTRQMLLVPLAFGASVPSSLRSEIKATLLEVNRAVTAFAASMLNVHVPVPEQLPDQPEKSDPAAAAAVSVTADCRHDVGRVEKAYRRES